MKKILLLLGLVVVAGVTALLLARPAPAPPIRLGINPWPGYAALFLAQEKGIFARHGLDVQLVGFTSVGDCLRGFQQGDTDGMACTLVEVAFGQQLNIAGKPVPVLVTDASHGADMILGKPGINTVADLRGKRVGVEPASLGLFILDRALHTHGLPSETVTVVPLGQEALAPALADGRIDAAVTYVPYCLTMEQAGAKRIFTTAEIPGQVIDVVAVSPTILARFPDLPQRMAAVWGDALAEIRRDPTSTHAILARNIGMTPADFDAALADLVMVQADQQTAFLAPGGAVDQALADVVRLLATAK